jgi:homoserine kinase
MLDPDFLKSVSAFAPATVANVGCGFDVLGFAIYGHGDLVTAYRTEKPGVRIRSIDGDGGRLPLEAEKNTAGLAVISLMKELDQPDIGVELVIEKRMPLGSGLGSSAASSVAATVAANRLLGSPFTKQELLPFAIEGESASASPPPADNVAASLLGGFVLVRSHQPPDVIDLPTPTELWCTVVHPHIEIQTRYSRQILKKQVPMEKAVSQWANVGALVAGFYREDYDLISRSLKDEIVEPVRSVLIPGYWNVKRAAIEAGALGGSISGSGPSVFALSRGEETARTVGNMMGKAFRNEGLEFDLHVSLINTDGAVVTEIS